MKKAMIMDIQRYSIHDGPGIRTTVFFKGCHMSCRWCHNPESQRQEKELFYYGERCIGCRSCIPLCPRGAHRMEGGVHRMDLAVCRGCERKEACSAGCPAEAIRLCGQEMDAAQLLEKVLADRAFYGEEGGVTCSGGEPLLWGTFLSEFLPLCKKAEISTCLDTTLNVAWERVVPLMPYVDLLLVDIKFMDKRLCQEYTGADAALTVENLRRLSETGKPVILRMPLISGVSDTEEELRARKCLLEELSNVRRVDCFAVTGHGAAKYKALQREFVPFNQGVDIGRLAQTVSAKIGTGPMGG